MTEIDITDITEGTVSGSGYFDQLMRAINSHLDLQFKENRLKGSDYANVYLGSIQYALQQAFQFGLQKIQTEEQIRASQVQTRLAEEQSEIDIALKAKQIEQINEQIESLNLEDVIKEGTYNDTLINTALERQLKELQTNDSLVTASKQREKIDEEIESLNLNDTLKQEQHDDQLLSTELDRELKQVQSDEQIASSQHERAIKQTQLDDSILTNTKQRLVLDEEIETANKQQVLLDTEEEIKQYQRDSILPEELAASQHKRALEQLETDTNILVKEEQIRASELDRELKEEQSDKDLLVKQEEIDASQHERSLKQIQSDKELEVKDAQIDKTEKEIESVDISISIAKDKAASDLVTAEKQRYLQDKQAESFVRDAEVNAVKALGDIWSIAKGVDDLTPLPGITYYDPVSEAPIDYMFNTNGFEGALNKMLAGVGVTGGYNSTVTS